MEWSETINMSDFCKKKDLSPSRRQLVELIERYRFSRIEHLEIRGGEPIFDPAPSVTEEIKFGAAEDAPPELSDGKFLCAPIAELFHHLKRLGDGRIAAIQIRHGLPFRLYVERSAGTRSVITPGGGGSR